MGHDDYDWRDHGLITTARVYACLLLDFAYRAFKTPMSGMRGISLGNDRANRSVKEARAMKTVIRAAKQCLGK